MIRPLNDIRADLRSPSDNPSHDSLLVEIREHKKIAVDAGNEAEAKDIWCLEHAAEAQQVYREAYDQLQAGKFYDAWCSLEQVELALNRLRPHAGPAWEELCLDFIDTKTSEIQSLFPYKMFLSPELLETQKKCNICDRIVSIRSPCGHRVGEIYGGEYCCRIVTEFEVIATAFVESPIQKYSVPFLSDPKTGKSRDHYNYSTVSYLAKRWPSPYHDWTVTWTTALHPKSRFGHLRRNDKCPCNSGKKYKACCQRREGILRPHVVFDFSYGLPVELQETEFSY